MEGTKLKGYYSVQEASKLLGISRQGVLYLIKEKTLKPVFFVDKYYLIPESTIQKLKSDRQNLTDNRIKTI